MTQPADRFYTKSHEWVKVDGELATVGITAYAQEQLGDVVFVELPAVGKSVVGGAVMGNIESVKAVSEVFAPVAGEVVEVNAEFESHPELLNKDPFGAGFLAKLKVAAGAAAGLISSAAYEAFLASEGAH